MAGRRNYPGSIEVLPSRAIRLRLSVGGKMHRETLKGVTRDEVEEYAHEKYKELKKEADRLDAGLPGRIAFSELVERFEDTELPGLAPNTRKSYSASFTLFSRFFVDDLGNPPLQKIRPGHIREYMKWRAAGAGPHTVARDRRVLNRLFSFALSLELVEANPVTPTKPPKPDPRSPVILTPGQLNALLVELEHRPMVRAYVLLLAETGLRSQSEALHLRWEDLDFSEGFLHVVSGREGHRTKTGRSRWVPMSPRLREALQEHAATFRLATYDGKRSPWVFHHRRSLRKHKKGSRVVTFQRAIKLAADRAKLPNGWRIHDLRHRRVTRWLAEGKNPVHVKEAVGHASLATTMMYTHLAREHLRGLVVEEGPEAAAAVGS